MLPRFAAQLIEALGLIIELRDYGERPTLKDKNDFWLLGATGRQGGAAAAQLAGRRLAGARIDPRSFEPGGAGAGAGRSGGCRGGHGRPRIAGCRDAGRARRLQRAAADWNPSDASARRRTGLGKNAVDAARDAGVRHFVYSSVNGADKQSRFRHLAKWEIEQYIRAIGLPATILRPSGFMENYAGPGFGVQNGTLAEATNPDVPVKLIAVDDIGAFVRLAFNDPETSWARRLKSPAMR